MIIYGHYIGILRVLGPTNFFFFVHVIFCVYFFSEGRLTNAYTAAAAAAERCRTSHVGIAYPEHNNIIMVVIIIINPECA